MFGVPAVLFLGQVGSQLLRVVDRGVAASPRLVVEAQLAPDAMGLSGWGTVDPITQHQFEALLIGAHVVS
jgi:hypothetical protein